MAVQYYEGIGRRKTSTARVRVMTGSGQFIINEKTLKEFFPRLGDVNSILGVFSAIAEEPTKFDVSAIVSGGGITGQTEAVRLGLARAMIKMDPDVQPLLKKNGLVTRDPREKERKKPGLKRARKAPTYTKR